MTSQIELLQQRRAERGPLRQLAEVRGWVGDFAAPHRDVRLRTADGVRVAASFLPGPDPDGPAAVLCHGFAAHRRKPAYALLADVLATEVSVLSVDLRGHGGSSGRSSMGGLEHHEVAVAIAWLRQQGIGSIAAVGVSMGATAVLGALHRGVAADAVALISAPAFHGRLRGDGIRDLHDTLHHPVRRPLWQLLAGFRVEPPTAMGRVPDPVALAADVSAPLLAVHGEDDAYFPPEDADALAAAPSGPATVWHEPAGFGHAEDGITPDFARALGRALRVAVEDGKWLDREQARR